MMVARVSAECPSLHKVSGRLLRGEERVICQVAPTKSLATDSPKRLVQLSPYKKKRVRTHDCMLRGGGIGKSITREEWNPSLPKKERKEAKKVHEGGEVVVR
ncbi:hypothetical protein ZHAS_00012342 [Anopheles sinensis]|uniref:Uncharacterized protein n=1 Tax=Anopheles sinensis TaxID=74873 RepID=A0A084W2F3_ANOSI|nr:hypothetical protein ZHAS_00012342 [Anopheles sinensis]